MAERITYFVDVLLPLALPELYTYRVPQQFNDQIEEGKRVVVQFGKKKIYSALIKKIHQKAPTLYEVKYILDILDAAPIVRPVQIKFWEWIASYYMCTEGEVMNAALPSAMKLASETKIVKNPDFKGDTQILNDREFLVWEALEHADVLTVSEVSEIVELKQVGALIKGLYEKGLIYEEQELLQKFRPKKRAYVKLESSFTHEENLAELMDKLSKKAPKQLDLMMILVQLAGVMRQKNEWVAKSKLLKKSQASSASLKALIDKGIVISEDLEVSRLEKMNASKTTQSIMLSQAQQRVMDEIISNFKTHPIQLLKGVTGSGKTEIYIKLIEKQLSHGKQVLFLLPEIALTSQIIQRLQQYFGDRCGIYHSRYSQNERIEVWQKMMDEKESYDIVVGARSAIFLPFKSLGLVIVDEEHDASYKQYDPAPRYNGRDAAIYLSRMHQGLCLLGSATPSIETFEKTKQGKYAISSLEERYGDIEMPQIQLVNIAEAARNKAMKSHFSKVLLAAIKDTVAKQEQVILFRNRRGFSLRVECEKCHWTPECKSCDVTLTYHKQIHKLKCHYCGYNTSLPSQCPACGSKRLKMNGFGTEKIESELAIFFPDLVIKRMDLDTTRAKNAYMQIIRDFEEGRIDILVGTQMVTKGLDFDNVGLVGVVNADSLLTYPDFRSSERAFQMLTQVSGRAGRKNKQGKVLIQTSRPEHPIIQDVLKYDYKSMVESQLRERNMFMYPPYFRLIRIALKHRDSRLLNEASIFYAQKLREKLGMRVLGPEYPPVARIKNYFIKNILVKVEVAASHRFVKDFILECNGFLDAKKEYRSIIVAVDVDPY